MNKLPRILGKAALFLGAMTLVAGASYVGAVTAGLTVGNPLFTAPVMACGQQSQGCPAPVVNGTSPTYNWTASANGAITINGQSAFDASVYDHGYVYVFVANVGTGGSIAGKTQDNLGNSLNANFQRSDTCGTPIGSLTYAGNWWQAPLHGQFFTLTLSGLTAGSPAGTVYFTKSQPPICPPTQIATGSINYGQAAIGTTSSVLVSARFGAPGVGRANLLITPTADIFCGNTGVTTTTGFLLKAGVAKDIATQDALYCVGASSTTATWLELF